MKLALYWAYGLATFVMVISVSASAQEMAGMSTPLATLISEAQSNNTQISAADHAWKAATHVAQQVTTLPDPQFTVQSFSVGSPKPFAGFSNSDFAYIGFGASQEVPYAGKLRLKGEMATREADKQETQADLLRSSITDQVKLLYLRLAYLDATLAILGGNDAVLKPMIETGLSRYSLGQGSQAEVLKAQIEHTKILREVTMHHEEMGQLQASLKELLHRSQTSPDIVPEPLSLTPLQRTATELQNLVLAHNPSIAEKLPWNLGTLARREILRLACSGSHNESEGGYKSTCLMPYLFTRLRWRSNLCCDSAIVVRFMHGNGQ